MSDEIPEDRLEVLSLTDPDLEKNLRHAISQSKQSAFLGTRGTHGCSSSLSVRPSIPSRKPQALVVSEAEGGVG